MSFRCALVTCLLAALGCGPSAPIDADAGHYPDYGVSDLFPLGVGSRWLYRDVDTRGFVDTLDKQLSGCTTLSFVDCDGETRTIPALVQHTPDIDDDEDSYYAVDIKDLSVNETGLMRVYEEVTVNGNVTSYDVYTPGFMRVMPPPYDVGRVELYETERCRCEQGACERVIVQHEHEVLPPSRITVPAGTFGAVGIERRNLATGEIKRHWYAPGVGRILEHRVDADDNVLSYEELTSYEVRNEPCEQ